MPRVFDLDGQHAHGDVAAAHSKQRREDRQPIRQDVADLLRTWLADGPRVSGCSLGCPATRPGCYGATWRRPGWNGSKEAHASTKRAGAGEIGLPGICNAAGEVVDFHSTRHTYISGIVAGGASVKTAQELARHSSPALTIGRYSHARLHDLQGPWTPCRAISLLPSTA